MKPDVLNLHNFYQTRLGGLAARLIAARIAEMWGDGNGLSVLGLGYAVPFLKNFSPVLPGAVSTRRPIARVIALMPAQQGVMNWAPTQGLTDRAGNLAGLVDEFQLPLPDASFDRVILAHILENTEQTRALLREVWRVLTPGGRIIVIVPNRRGLWTQFERTPFGVGRPYSRPQLCDTLAASMLTPIQWRYSLHGLPLDDALTLKALTALERPGLSWWRRLGGVLIMEAEKQIYAMTPEFKKSLSPRPVVAEEAAHRPRNSSRSPS